VFGYWYWHNYFAVASLLIDIEPKLASNLTEFERKIKHMMDEKIIDSIDIFVPTI